MITLDTVLGVYGAVVLWLFFLSPEPWYNCILWPLVAIIKVLRNN
jgi:hypothetical protein